LLTCASASIRLGRRFGYVGVVLAPLGRKGTSTLKKLVLVATVLLVLGVAAGALSVYLFGRAGNTGDLVVAALDRGDEPWQPS
jgi:hypothetical protein